MKETFSIVFSIVLFIVGGSIILNYQKSKIDYVDTYCPECGCTEVIDYGTDNYGNQKCHCFDCELNFTIIEKNSEEYWKKSPKNLVISEKSVIFVMSKGNNNKN